MTAAWATSLLTLQGIDMRIRELNYRLSLIPEERRRIADAKNRIDADIGQRRQQIKDTEQAIRHNEDEIHRIEKRVNQLKQQSSIVKKNDEYKALITEIDAVKERVGKMENTVLEQYEHLEKQQMELKGCRSEAAARIQALKNEWMDFEQQEMEMRREISEKQRLRSKATDNIEGSLLRRYELLLTENNTLPLSPITDGSCGNCFLRLTPQTITMAKRGVVTECDHCHHLIYLDDL